MNAKVLEYAQIGDGVTVIVIAQNKIHVRLMKDQV